MDKVFGALRAIVAAISGALVALGILDADAGELLIEQIEIIIGAIGVIGTIIASIMSKLKAEERTKEKVARAKEARRWGAG